MSVKTKKTAKKTAEYFLILFIIQFCLLAFTTQVYAKCTQPDCKYYTAENAYNKLLKNQKLKNRRDKWIDCISMFKAVTAMEPKGTWAAPSLYMTGLLYNNLYKYSHNKKDLSNAVDYLNRTTKFKKSRYSQEAYKLLRKLPTPKKANNNPPPVKHKKSKRVKKIKKKPPVVQKKYTGKKTTVKGLRHGSLPTRTRIVIDTDKAVEFKYGLLKKNVNKNKRLYVDLKKSTLGKNVREKILLDDKRVSSIRMGYYTPEVVRIAIDLKTYRDYKIFALRSPARVVIDIWGHSTSASGTNGSAKTEDNSQSVTNIISSLGNDLAKQFALGVKTIVIDPGHGGKDRGAPGYTKGTYEKDIVLSIGKKLAKRIKQELKCEVILTRSTDKFITLEERTRIANRNKADLFISIHTNASRSKKAYGIETYFLNLAKDKTSVSVAARENATTEKNISDLQTILNSLMKNTKITESSKLAKYVQRSLYSTLRKKYSRIKNKGVKQAPFYVLLGARMPSILVETSFISNKRECNRLKAGAYQDRICNSIVNGIKKYIDETKF